MNTRLVTYQKIFPTANQFFNERVGIEIIVNDGENANDALNLAKKTVEDWHKQSNDMEIVAGNEPIPIVQVDKGDVNQQKIIDGIKSCTDATILQETYKFIVRKYPEIQDIYRQKLVSLSNK